MQNKSHTPDVDESALRVEEACGETVHVLCRLVSIRLGKYDMTTNPGLEVRQIPYWFLDNTESCYTIFPVALTIKSGKLLNLDAEDSGDGGLELKLKLKL